MAEESTEVTVILSVLRVRKTGRERRQGIVTESRQWARQWCSEHYGWEEVRTEVVRSLPEVVDIRCSPTV